jgi:hypothetical protein
VVSLLGRSVQKYVDDGHERIQRRLRVLLSSTAPAGSQFTLTFGSSFHADVQFINVNLIEATNRFSHFQSIATSAFVFLGHASV